MFRRLLGIALISVVTGVGASGVDDRSPAKRQLDFALGLYQRGDFEEAAAEFEAFLEHEDWLENRTTCLFFYGETLRRLNDLEKAETAYRRLLSLYPDSSHSPICRYRLAEIDLARKDGEAALKMLAPLADQPVSESLREGIYYSLGLANSLVGNSTRAIDWWTRLRKEFPQSESAGKALLGIGIESARRKQCDAAVRSLEEWLKLPDAPNREGYPEALKFLARCEEREGHLEKALQHYRTLSKTASVPDIREAAMIAAARLALSLNRPDLFDSIGEELSRSSDDPGTLYLWHILAGNRFYREKQWESAADHFEEALVLSERIVREASEIPVEEVRLRLAWCLLGLKKWQRIVEVLKPVPSGGKTADEHAFLMGQAYAHLRGWREAYEWFSRVHEGARYAPEARLGMADAAYHLERWREVSEIYGEHLPKEKSSRRRVFYLLRCAEAEKSLENWADAAILAASAAETTTDPALRERALYLAGWCCLKGGDHRCAARFLERLIGSHPESERVPESLWMLGQVYEEIGDTTKECSVLSRLTTEFPSSPWCPQALVRVAAAYARTGDRDKVLETLLSYQKRFPAEPLNEEYSLWLAEELLVENRLDEVLNILAGLDGRDLNDEQRETLWHLTGRAQESLGQWKQALETYLDALSVYPEGRHQLENRLGAARAARELDDRLEAWKQIRSAIETLNRLSTVDQEIEAQIFLLAGDLAFEEEDYETAYRYYARPTILYRHPVWTPEALYKSALAKEKMGETEAARNLREELRKEYPDYKPEKGS